MVENSATILSNDWLRETLEAYDRGTNPFHDDSEAYDLQEELAEFIESEIEDRLVEQLAAAEAVEEAKKDDLIDNLTAWAAEAEVYMKIMVQDTEVKITISPAVMQQIIDKIGELIE